MIFHGRSIHPGTVIGQALVSRMGISFFGGVDPESGVVVERGHDLEGQSIAGKVLVFPSGKGSTVGSYTLYRLKANGKEPQAILNAECETITAVGCIIGEIPCIDHLPVSEIRNGQRLLVQAAEGRVEILDAPAGPPGPLPEPLRGNEPGSFAETTLSVRLPEIARRAANENGWAPGIAKRLHALADEMPHGRLTSIDDPGAPDASLWPDYMARWLSLEKNWLDVAWFPVEIYFFRRILQATGYYQLGAGSGVDPYHVQKRHGMDGTAQTLAPWCIEIERWFASPDRDRVPAAELFIRMLPAAVWGNQADQSVFPAGAEQPGRPDKASLTANLLVNDARPAVDALVTRGRDHPPRVDFVLDNCGMELAYDLLLADYLLLSGLAGRVIFHAKMYPTYVSDVTPQDVTELLDYIGQGEGVPTDVRAALQRLSRRLMAALADGRLQIQTHPFWVSPGAGWEMPADLWADLHTADLIINKGDANYRRSIGDRRWPETTDFGEILAYRPAPWLAVRVLKADVVVGLKPGQAERIASQDPAWMTSGRWALIQYAG